MLKVGDVFRGTPGFAFGRNESVGTTHYREGLDRISVADSYKETYVIREVKSYDKKTGAPNYAPSKKHAHDDKSRPKAEFVVEAVTLTGGDSTQFIKNEPHVTARRLNNDGTYNPAGELVVFVDCAAGQRSNFTTAVTVTPHRAMQRTVTFV